MFSIRKTLADQKQAGRDRELTDGLGLVELRHYPLPVNYSADIKQLVDDGKYDFIDSKVSEQIKGQRFLRSTKFGQENLNIVQIQFGREMFLHDALDLVLTAQLRSTGITELLHWGITYPKQQLRCPIVAPNAITRNSGYLVFLSGHMVSGRDLLAQPLGNSLSANVRFLAIDPA